MLAFDPADPVEPRDPFDPRLSVRRKSGRPPPPLPTFDPIDPAEPRDPFDPRLSVRRKSQLTAHVKDLRSSLS